MPEPKSDLSLLLEAAEEAGAIALSHFQRDPETWDKGDGAGPVTEADLAVDAMLRRDLLAARPYGWLSEETEDDPARLSAERLFIVDPIDGTRAFISGSKTWAISIAVVENGVPVAGVVHLPAHGRTFAAAKGEGATLNGDALTASTVMPGDETILSAKVNFSPKFWREVPPQPELAFRSSLAYRLAAIAQGRFDAMLTLRSTWEWDVAAGTLLAQEAGARVVTTEGTAPRFNSPSAALPGILAGAPSLIDHYLAHGPRLPAA
ncbi:MAG: 3'(2'),5'-bisphosphate nucleotidase CysQ [Pseudomonadota bacterium]